MKPENDLRGAWFQEDPSSWLNMQDMAGANQYGAKWFSSGETGWDSKWPKFRGAEVEDMALLEDTIYICFQYMAGDTKDMFASLRIGYLVL